MIIQRIAKLCVYSRLLDSYLVMIYHFIKWEQLRLLVLDTSIWEIPFLCGICLFCRLDFGGFMVN